MIERWNRFAPIGLAIVFSSVPLFPAFITLTNVQFPGISVVPLPFALGVLAAMVLLGLWAIPALLAPPWARAPLMLPMLALIGSALVSALLGLNPRDGFIFIAIFALGIVWHLGIMRFYDAPWCARAIFWAYLLSGIAACVAAIVMVVTRIPAAQYAIANGRAVGSFVLPGELAGYAIVLIPVAYAIMRVARERALRVVAGIALGAAALAMVLTFSRTGWVGLACAIAFLIAARSTARGRGIATGAAIVVATVGLVLVLFNERHNPSENYTRLAIWQAAIGAIDRFPLTGAGPFGFSHLYPLVRLPDGDATAFHAHSMYLTFLAELGVVGFSALCWMLVAFARELTRRLADAGPAARLLALGVTAGIVGGLVQGLIDTVTVFIFGLMLPMLALALVTARSGALDA